jgi:hypothetical protein
VGDGGHDGGGGGGDDENPSEHDPSEHDLTNAPPPRSARSRGSARTERTLPCGLPA